MPVEKNLRVPAICGHPTRKFRKENYQERITKREGGELRT